ncbi:hypothetical protein OBBRIDRAFT_300321 [Obba rivulosa]|uniref:Uncharacterized protein n=1 Tax=Obba rivulosa TaxID=1052685 RepID=A0A8E2AJB1_9APHY|nr:hypothetical protein OBBRIDRAFT_300321 [Obba rivulosa]
MSIRSLDSAGEAEIWEEAFRMLFPGIEPGTEHLSGTFSAVSEPFVLPTVDEPSQSHPTTPVNINGYSSSASTYNFDFGTRPYGDDAPNLLRHDLPSSTSPTFTDILTPPSTTGVAPEIPGWTAPASDQLGVDFDLTDFSASAWDVIFPPDPLYVAKDGPNGHHLLNGLSVAVADGWSASNDTSIGLPAYQTVLMNQITDIDVLNEELGQQFQSTSHKSALRPLHEAPPDFLSPFQTQLQHTTPTTIFAESGGASDSPYRLPAAPAPSPPSTSSGPTARERQTDRVPGVYPSSTALGKRRAEPEQETVGMQGSKRARLVLDGHFEGPAVASVGGFEAGTCPRSPPTYTMC